MEAVRSRWTDERLDDLNHKVDDLGRRMDDGFRELRTEMGANQRTMTHLVGALIAAQVGVIATLVGLILAQS
jgi:hypothetical protein